jgi:hypothetical protein
MIPHIWTRSRRRDLPGIMRKVERRDLVREEFGNIDLGDLRRSRRAVSIAERVAAYPGSSIPAAMGDRAMTEAVYRHLSSDEVTIGALLEPHIQRTAERVKRAGLAFAVADTTDFSFPGETEREGLGPINTASKGFLAHVTLAVAADGSRTPLGLLAHEVWAREGIKHTRKVKCWKRRRASDRESLRWGRGMAAATARTPGVPLIHVADRDSDMYEVLAQLLGAEQRFVLRAAQNRSLEPLDEEDARYLFDAARNSPTQYTVEVPLSARGAGVNRPTGLKKRFPKRGCRAACLSFAARRVTLKRPVLCFTEFPKVLEVNIVHAFELGPPTGQRPVEWLLLTSEPIRTAEEIAFVAEGYRTRWVVEEYFKAVKTGCAFESKQLESFHTLTNMLGFVLVVAYALLLVRSLSTAKTSEPASAILSADQVAVLKATVRAPLPAVPTAREALLAVASLGGHLKSNGDPGWQVLSRGWQKLLDYERGYAIAAARRCDQS